MDAEKKEKLLRSASEDDDKERYILCTASSKFLPLCIEYDTPIRHVTFGSDLFSNTDEEYTYQRDNSKDDEQTASRSQEATGIQGSSLPRFSPGKPRLQ